MPTPELAKQADAVRADIARLEADLKTLLNTVGGAVGAAISGRISEPMKSISAHIEPLLNMLGATGDFPVPFKRGPGRPKRDAGDAPKRRGRRGGRGKKVNLTPEAIADALKQTSGNKSAAARVLAVSLPTFYKYLGTSGAPAEQAKSAKKPAPASKKPKK